MKRKLLLANALMGLMILFAILFQSFHSFEHLAKEISEKKCHHSHHGYKARLTHGHDGLEKCFVCEFAFSNATEPTYTIVGTESNFFFFRPSFFNTSQDIPFYTGNSSLLRGPPQLIL